MNRAEQSIYSVLFYIIRDLEPKIVCDRPQIYINEFNRLRSESLCNFFLPDDKLIALKKGIQDCCNGYFNARKSIIGRENLWKKSRLEWYKSKRIDIQKGDSFIGYRDNWLKSSTNFLYDLRTNFSKITECGLNLTNEDVSSLMANLDQCPAFRSHIYSKLYQEFIFACDGNIPAKDKFTDSIQLIEASCCAVYITGDARHLKYADQINPTLEYKLAHTLILDENNLH